MVAWAGLARACPAALRASPALFRPLFPCCTRPVGAGWTLPTRGAHDQATRVRNKLDTAKALLHNGHAQHACTLYGEVLRADSTNWEARGGVADSLFALGKYYDALQHYQAVTTRIPRFFPAHTAAAQCLAALGSKQQALDTVNRVLGMDSSYTPAFGVRGDLLLELGEVEAAVGCFREVLAREPHNLMARAQLGQALLASGEGKDEARACFEKALEGGGAVLPALRGMGFVCYDEKEYATALGYANRALSAEPHAVDCLLLRAACLTELGEFEKALDDCATIERLAPALHLSWFVAGKCSFSLGRHAQARQQLGRFIVAFEDTPHAQLSERDREMLAEAAELRTRATET